MSEDNELIIRERIICAPSSTALKAFFYAIEMGVADRKSALPDMRHTFDSWLFAAVTHGSGTLIYGDEEFSFSAGDCILIDCRIPCSCTFSEAAPSEMIWLHFSGATSAQYYEAFTEQSAIIFHPFSFEKTAATIREIHRINSEKNNNAEALTSGHIAQLLTIALTSGCKTDNMDSALKKKLQAVNAYIEENFTEDISLERLSADFYISKYYLSRQYKRIYGKTIFQHIIACRINYGKHLLRFSDNSVEEIAHLCGFNDQSYFVRQFKKAENTTCFVYRKKWRE